MRAILWATTLSLGCAPKIYVIHASPVTTIAEYPTEGVSAIGYIQPYQIGQQVEAYCTTGDDWYAATILDVDEQGRVQVHYNGWSSDWDEWLGPDFVRPHQ